MKFERVCAMPNKRTFQIKPIKKLIREYLKEPFLDLFPYPYKTDSLIFIKAERNQSYKTILYDPPYSLRQLKEVYESKGLALTQEYTQIYWNYLEREIDRVLQPGGICIKFGWNSKRISKNFKIIDILLVNHGGNHNDTICTAQKKMNGRLD